MSDQGSSGETPGGAIADAINKRARVRQARDKALVEAARDGDTTAFGHLYDEWVDHVYDRAINSGASAAEAREITEQTFVVSWRDLDKLKQPAAYGAKVMQVARRETQARVGPVARPVPSGPPKDAGSSPEDRLSRATNAATAAADHDVATVLREAANALDDRTREILDLHFRQGLTRNETAAVIGEQPDRVTETVAKLPPALAVLTRARVLWRGGKPEDDKLAAELRKDGVESFNAAAVRTINRFAKDNDRARARSLIGIPPIELYSSIPLADAPAGLKMAVAGTLVTEGVPMDGSSFVKRDEKGEVVDQPKSREAETGQRSAKSVRPGAEESRPKIDKQKAAVVAAAALAAERASEEAAAVAAAAPAPALSKKDRKAAAKAEEKAAAERAAAQKAEAERAAIAKADADRAAAEAAAAAAAVEVEAKKDGAKKDEAKKDEDAAADGATGREKTGGGKGAAVAAGVAGAAAGAAVVAGREAAADEAGAPTEPLDGVDVTDAGEPGGAIEDADVDASTATMDAVDVTDGATVAGGEAEVEGAAGGEPGSGPAVEAEGHDAGEGESEGSGEKDSTSTDVAAAAGAGADTAKDAGGATKGAKGTASNASPKAGATAKGAKSATGATGATGKKGTTGTNGGKGGKGKTAAGAAAVAAGAAAGGVAAADAEEASGAAEGAATTTTAAAGAKGPKGASGAKGGAKGGTAATRTTDAKPVPAAVVVEDEPARSKAGMWIGIAAAALLLVAVIAFVATRGGSTSNVAAVGGTSTSTTAKAGSTTVTTAKPTTTAAVTTTAPVTTTTAPADTTTVTTTATTVVVSTAVTPNPSTPATPPPATTPTTQASTTSTTTQSSTIKITARFENGLTSIKAPYTRAQAPVLTWSVETGVGPRSSVTGAGIPQPELHPTGRMEICPSATGFNAAGVCEAAVGNYTYKVSGIPTDGSPEVYTQLTLTIQPPQSNL